MPTAETGLWILLALVALNFILLVVLLLRRPPADPHAELAAALAAGHERTERGLRQEIGESARGTRQELGQNFASFQAALVQQGAEATRTQNAQIDAFAQQLTLLQKTLADTLSTQLQGLSESNARRLAEVRATMETQLAQLQQSNAAKLDEMRQTVDEKLQTTLEARLGESFKQVADRLDQVHKGLGEMQTLAVGVGSLQRVLTNVKTRGVFGEVQLEALLEQVLTPDQYAKQVETKPRSNQRVDFAIRFPGRGEDGAPVWLPVDAKFPRDDYERLIDAHERADAAGAELAAKALEARIRAEAKSIAENYLAAPHTTDFAILFLPVESLYAEVLRRPGLMDAIQRQHRVTLAGPTTLLAMLNSLHMGFRTLALEQQASEVWKVLGAVKTEFERYGEWVARIKEQVAKASDTLDKADTRAKQMRLALRKVEALPEAQSQALLPGTADTESDGPL
ncbi:MULTISPECIES: DNA recombination protein RmuC [unclassified Variovorax]|uniref:DNA recombination protein RmuC n=1 Tax=unclassified Variovorax TaxID=663243 RepID=UPI002577D0A2|nr:MULTISPECIES: DNA recombination protein RmuC [unclassified Variovorax]MDM0088803.1 DNA recombination protein RmuC [Variovorax sp. J22G40]MDM0146876.1 DNA recombination protein RmuC [Variovorax sp. J2P1-31]